MSDGGPAFPIPDIVSETLGCGIRQGHDGMSLRDFFAGQALKATVQSGFIERTPLHLRVLRWLTGYCPARFSGCEPRDVARSAYQYADAMIIERTKGNP